MQLDAPHLFLIIAWLLLGCFPTTTPLAQSSDLMFSLDSVTVAEDGTEEVFLRVMEFDSIVSLQFSLNWDPTIAEFVAAEEVDLSSTAIGLNDTELGQLRFSWFSPDGFPQSLPDGSRLLRLRLRAVGAEGQSTSITVADTPLFIQAFRGTSENGGFVEIGVSSTNGLFSIAAPVAVNVQTVSVGCFGASTGQILLTTPPGSDSLRFEWTDENGNEVNDLNALTAGTYLLVVRNMTGDSLFSTTATVDGPTSPLRWTNIENRAAGCETDDGIIAGLADGGWMPYVYRLQESENSSGSFGGLSDGEYILMATDAMGCVIADTLLIERNSPPQLSVSDTTLSLCNVSDITLEATAEGEVEYRWSTGASTNSLTVETPGLYTLVASIGDCRDTAVFEVLGGEAVNAVLETDLFPLCPGDSLTLDVAGGTQYDWLSPAPDRLSNDGSTAEIAPDTSINYRVAVSTSCGADTLEIPVVVFEVLATAGPDSCIAPGEELELYARGGIFYTWAEAEFPVSNPNIPDPVVAPEETTVYSVLIEDINGCLTLDSLTVELAENPAESIRAVNAITPNGDGKNDVLEFRNAEKFGRNSLRIYNRWGRLVYNKLNYQSDAERFDGTFLGEDLPAGTYYYVIEFAAGTIKQTLLISR